MSATERTYDNLLAAGPAPQTDRQTLKSGENIAKGTLLGKITSSGLLVPCKSSANDGSQNPYRIALTDADATDGALTITTYMSGAFIEDSIILAETGDVIDDFKDAAADIGIFFKPAVGVAEPSDPSGS